MAGARQEDCSPPTPLLWQKGTSPLPPWSLPTFAALSEAFSLAISPPAHGTFHASKASRSAEARCLAMPTEPGWRQPRSSQEGSGRRVDVWGRLARMGWCGMAAVWQEKQLLQLLPGIPPGLLERWLVPGSFSP